MDSDTLHEFGHDPEWNESFYFNFYDKTRDICAFMRLGLKPNMNEKTAFVFLMMPGNSILAWKDRESLRDTELAVKDLRFQKVHTEKKWHLEFSGTMEKHKENATSSEQVSFGVDYESLNEVFDYRDCIGGTGEKISERIAVQHLEQFGRARGTLRVGVDQYALDGLGERDHSWGVRDWNAPKMWMWLTCQFSKESALNVTKLVMDEGEVDAGFIHMAGKNVPLTKVEIETSWDTRREPKSLEMKLEDKKGTAYNVRAYVMRKAIVPFASRDGKNLSLMHENLARYEMDSNIGYGIAEYLIRTR